MNPQIIAAQARVATAQQNVQAAQHDALWADKFQDVARYGEILKQAMAELTDANAALAAAQSAAQYMSSSAMTTGGLGALAAGIDLLSGTGASYSGSLLTANAVQNAAQSYGLGNASLNILGNTLDTAANNISSTNPAFYSSNTASSPSSYRPYSDSGSSASSSSSSSYTPYSDSSSSSSASGSYKPYTPYSDNDSSSSSSASGSYKPYTPYSNSGSSNLDSSYNEQANLEKQTAQRAREEQQRQQQLAAQEQQRQQQLAKQEQQRQQQLAAQRAETAARIAQTRKNMKEQPVPTKFRSIQLAPAPNGGRYNSTCTYSP